MNYQSRLNGAISSTDTTIVINGANGLPRTSGQYYLCLDNETNVQEIVLVIARSGYNLFVTRGQAGTTAVSWSDDALIRDFSRDFLVAGTGITLNYDVTTQTKIIDSGGLTQAQVLARVSMGV